MKPFDPVIKFFLAPERQDAAPTPEEVGLLPVNKAEVIQATWQGLDQAEAMLASIPDRGVGAAVVDFASRQPTGEQRYDEAA